MAAPGFDDGAKALDTIIEKLMDGYSLSEICIDDGLPNRCTVQRWQNEDPDVDAAVMRAREIGFHARAERAVIDAKAAKDAALGRLAFDVDRWYIGKLSNAFSDKQKVELGGDIQVLINKPA